MVRVANASIHALMIVVFVVAVLRVLGWIGPVLALVALAGMSLWMQEHNEGRR